MSKYLLSAGAARSSITPGKNILPLPFMFSVVMDGIADQIYVRVLDLDAWQKRVLFITFDMGMIPYPDETMKFVCDYTGLNKENIFLAATHAHEVPFIGFALTAAQETVEKHRAWYAEIQEALEKAIRQAEKNKRPARIGYSTGKSYININRDEIIDGKGEIGNNFERPSDKTVSLVRLEDEEGLPISLIVNYAVHAVVMNGCSVDGKVKISGDLPGRTSTILEEKLDGAIVLWTSGAAGDQNPRIMTQYGVEMKNGTPNVKSLGEAGYMILDFLTNEHVRDILAVNKTLICDKSEAEIFTAEHLAICPKRISDSIIAKTLNIDEQATTVSYTLKLVIIGDIAFQGISAEVVTSIGTALKSTSPVEKTMIITHANNYHGYVPDDWGYENNTFEANGTLVQKGYAENAFINGFAKLFDEINNKN